MTYSHEQSNIWVAASYVFPSLYSCRAAMSSMSSVSITPTPGPGTIRLALMRVSIEHYGTDYVRECLFPVIRSATILIRPPDRIAISTHNLRAYKGNVDRQEHKTQLTESIIYREYAYTSGRLTIYLKVPAQFSNIVQAVLMSIGYWGQAHSLAQCVCIDHTCPNLSECAQPLRNFHAQSSVSHFVTGLVTEFRDGTITWSEVVGVNGEPSMSVIHPQLYIWPMKTTYQHKDDRILCHYLL